MSVAKAIRRKMVNGFACLGDSMRRPRYRKHAKSHSVAESIARERAADARQRKISSGSKK